jgi:hypothetical protein
MGAYKILEGLVDAPGLDFLIDFTQRIGQNGCPIENIPFSMMSWINGTHATFKCEDEISPYNY